MEFSRTNANETIIENENYGRVLYLASCHV
jgi:hypothetical protein